MRSGLMTGWLPPPSMKKTRVAAPSKIFSFFGQPSRAMTGQMPSVCFSRFMRTAQPAKNSCSPGPWLLLPATRTIFFPLKSAGGSTSRGTLDWSYGSTPGFSSARKVGSPRASVTAATRYRFDMKWIRVGRRDDCSKPRRGADGKRISGNRAVGLFIQRDVVLRLALANSHEQAGGLGCAVFLRHHDERLAGLGHVLESGGIATLVLEEVARGAEIVVD